MLVVFISALKRKLLFGFRLFLLVIIITILATQIYAVFRPAPPPEGDAAPTWNSSAETMIDRFTEHMKEYYRGNLR